MIYSEDIEFADDTVIYVVHNEIKTLEKRLNEDLVSISKFFEQNDLIINLKKGKTECMIFGTAKKVKLAEINLKYNHEPISNTISYTYLSIFLDPVLSLNEHFEKSYKKALGRVRLMYHMAPHLTSKAALEVYKSVVVPLITYCGIININLRQTQLMKFTSLERRVLAIIQSCSNTRVILTPMNNLIKRRACVLVQQCLQNETCTNFKDYFIRQQHTHMTRNNNVNCTIPKIRLTYAKNGFFFMGVQLFNNLPPKMKSIKDTQKFKKEVKSYF